PERNAATRDDELAALQPLFQRTMQALNHANIAIYPIDARGLVAYSSASVSRVRINDVYGTEAQTHTTMNDIASTTGGRAYYNTNDIAGAFAEALNDSTRYYMLAYYAPGAKKPGWRKLQVSVGRPGLNVRARAGYMAGVAVKKPEDLSRLDVRTALRSPLDYTAVPLWLHWYGQPAAGTGIKKKVPFAIFIPPQGSAIDTGANNRVSLEIVAVARNAQGEIAGRFGQRVEDNLKDDAAKRVAAEGINFSESIEVPPGQYSVRFVVRDNVSGRVGSVAAPLKVQ
ncbi:MAG: VWA domain-containing protein, partial [Terriglobales bacterium]